MNRIRKIANWLWLNKERMVLAVMVGFLIFRVYQVVSPASGEENKRMPRPPGNELPDDANPPGDPPPPPPPPRTEDWSRLWRFNPFVWRAPQGGGGPEGDNADDINLRLLRIREVAPGQIRAQIDSGTRESWYAPGQAFETYEVLSIDQENGVVTVFSERHQRSVELRIEN